MPFDIGFGEIVLIGIVALIVVGPRDLPQLFRSFGRFTGRMRGLADEFRYTMERAADESGVGDIKREFQGIARDEAARLEDASAGFDAKSSARLDEIDRSARELEADLEKSENARPESGISEESRERAEDLRAKAELIKAEARVKMLREKAREAETKKKANKKAGKAGKKPAASEGAASKDKKSASSQKTAAKTAKKTAAKPARKTATEKRKTAKGASPKNKSAQAKKQA